MLEIVFHSLILLYNCVSIESQIDFEWDKKLIAIDKEYKCGIENKFRKRTSSRIINGLFTDNFKYPWMAEILLMIIKSDGTHEFSGTGAGSVISDKSILTAAHNLCLPHENNGFVPNLITCLESVDNKIQQNQNRPENQVHYSIGSMELFGDRKLTEMEKNYQAAYKKEIKAFVYKYEPKWWDEGSDEIKKHKREFYKYGDVGLIIDDSSKGLNLLANQAIPICLPSPQAFKMENQEGFDSKQKGFEVTVVGRGDLYVDDDTQKISSCMTNEGVAKKRDPGNEHVQETFLQCKDKDLAHKYTCKGIKNAIVTIGSKRLDTKGYEENLISVYSKIRFVGYSLKHGRKMEIDIPENDECKTLSNAITDEVYKADKDISLLWKGEPSRIVVFNKPENLVDWDKEFFDWEKQPSPDIPYCYNLKKVAKYGICETESDKYNFGFCSSSCLKKHPLDFDGRKRFYWELKAEYRETMDKEDEFNSKFEHDFRKIKIIFNLIFNCQII